MMCIRRGCASQVGCVSVGRWYQFGSSANTLCFTGVFCFCRVLSAATAFRTVTNHCLLANFWNLRFWHLKADLIFFNHLKQFSCKRYSIKHTTNQIISIHSRCLRKAIVWQRLQLHGIFWPKKVDSKGGVSPVIYLAITDEHVVSIHD